jgi:hypothetical protein
MRMASGERGVDFITIDGGEGGTGAGPLAFTDHVALPFKVGSIIEQFQVIGGDQRRVRHAASPADLRFASATVAELFGYARGVGTPSVSDEATLRRLMSV